MTIGIKIKKGTRKRQYTWYLEPKNAFTNEVISRGLPEENAYFGILCADKTKHYLWECPQELINFLWKSKDYLRLKFEIYRRFGKGSICNCTFLYDKRRARRKKKTK